jgi:hypothetical protein
MNKSSDNSGNINCEITTIKRTHWRESATLNLISLYSANEEQFKNPNIKNETVWKNIATQLKEDGFNCNHKQGEFKWKHSDVSISQENYISNKLTTWDRKQPELLFVQNLPFLSKWIQYLEKKINKCSSGCFGNLL